jgi:hypothetical protein
MGAFFVGAGINFKAPFGEPMVFTGKLNVQRKMEEGKIATAWVQGATEERIHQCI